MSIKIYLWQAMEGLLLIGGAIGVPKQNHHAKMTLTGEAVGDMQNSKSTDVVILDGQQC